MRVIFLGTRGFPNVQGGVEKHCEEMTTNLVKLGCEVFVFTRAPYVDKALKEYKGVKLVVLPAVRVKSLEAFLHTFIGVFTAVKFKADILHIQGIGPALFVPLARLLGMRVVLTSHGSNYRHQKWGKFARMILKLGEYLGVTFSDEVIAISKTIAEELRNRYKREVNIIPNGVVLPKVSTTAEVLRKFDLEKANYIFSVGRFVKGKGFEDLIEASTLAHKSAHMAAKEGRDLGHEALRFSSAHKLIIAGSADHEDEYSRELKRKASGTRDVILPGFLTGHPLEELYSHAGLFVLPSYYEGLPIVVLEAMSYGLSCLVSDIPPNREIGLDDDRYFKPGDIDVLTAKLKEFLIKPLKEEQRQNQIRMVAERYNWEKIAQETLEVYKKVLNGASALYKGSKTERSSI